MNEQLEKLPVLFWERIDCVTEKNRAWLSALIIVSVALLCIYFVSLFESFNTRFGCLQMKIKITISLLFKKVKSVQR